MIELLLIIAIVGVVAWAIIKLVPMPAPFGTIVTVVAVLIVLLLVLRAFGGIDVPLHDLD